jgi:hypothetical protein
VHYPIIGQPLESGVDIRDFPVSGAKPVNLASRKACPAPQSQFGENRLGDWVANRVPQEESRRRLYVAPQLERSLKVSSADDYRAIEQRIDA